jgi:hypothetical protein
VGDRHRSEIQSWTDGASSGQSWLADRRLYDSASDYSDRPLDSCAGRQDGRSATMPRYGHQHAERPGATHCNPFDRTQLSERPRDLRVGEAGEQGLPGKDTALTQKLWNTAVDLAYLLQAYAERLFYWTVRHRDLHQYKEADK